MRKETLHMLCNPYTGEPFKLEGEKLIGVVSGQTFPIRQGIPQIITQQANSGRSRTSKLIYDLSAFVYDSILKLGDLTRINSEGILRKEFIQNLEIQQNAKILETAAGTAENLFYLPPEIDYYALDISFQMLKKAQRKGKAANREIECFQAEGAFIPFRDDTFDVVIQMGGLQFYSDPFKGVSEMARVAKPGTTIYIIDEIRGAQRTLAPHPAHTKYSTSAEKAVDGIRRLVPHSMKATQSYIFPDTDFYVLTFQKPAIPQPYNFEK
jgi:ubiquinone/menaquinone biosynthesis C-methylase UbiE